LTAGKLDGARLLGRCAVSRTESNRVAKQRERPALDPVRLPPTDPLSDVLRVVRLESAFFYPVEASDPWCVEAAPAKDLTPRIMPGAEHLISYHILTAGHCYAGVPGAPRVEMAAGDVIVFPHGDGYVMSSDRDPTTRPPVYGAAPARYPHTVVIGGSPHRSTRFLCGFLGCDRKPFNPLLGALPRQLHVPGMSSAWITAFTSQVTLESAQGRPGANTVLTRMAELMFIEVLRRYLDELPAGQTGWLAGLRDEVVGRTLTQLHSRPGDPWTLANLALEVASSRSSLAKRFMEIVGTPPMHYLAQWRMQLAANLLAQSGAKVSTIAADVGYDSEAAFSRAFKKATGLAPGAWRETRRSRPI